VERAGDILKGVFSPPLNQAGAKYLSLFQNWRSIVGKDLEKHVVLQDIRKDALIAEVAHPGWLQAVLLRKKTIIKRINTLYPGLGIREIRVGIMKKPVPRVILPKKPETPAAADEEKPYSSGEIEALLSGMDENELKKALKKLYSARGRRRTEQTR
jgi:hypothetical protein